MRIETWSTSAVFVVPWWVPLLVVIGVAACAAGFWWVLRRATKRR
jgi:hypothetical protein